MPTRGGSQLTRRFVFLSEVFGYCLSGAIFLGLITTIFIRVDVEVKATGELKPVCFGVTHPRDFLLLEFLVTDGDSVVADQTVARVQLNTTAQRRSLARRQLLESVSLLESDAAAESDAALQELKRALAKLPPIEDFESVITSQSGVLRRELLPWQDGILSGGTLLARVCDPRTLEMHARLGESEGGHRIGVGQRALVVIEDLDAVLTGEVVEVSRDESDARFRLEFQAVPAEVQSRFRESFVGRTDDEFPSLQADIIVGSRSLFMEMFGRGEHAK